MAVPKLKVIRNIKSDAVLFGHGRSGDRFVDDTTGTHNFWQLYVKCLNATGITRGLRLDMTQGDGSASITATSEVLRAYLKSDVPVPAGPTVISAYLDMASGTMSGGQAYVGSFVFAQTAGSAVGGGRQAVLNLNNTFADAGYSGNGAACSFINFADGNGTYKTPTLFTLPNATVVDNTIFSTNTASPTHGLQIYCNNVKYWICCVGTRTS